jgi:hypothetical protein
MANLTADRKSERKQGIIFELPAAATAHIYSGSMVSVDANGYLVPASDSSTESFLGISRRESDNSSGANGDILSEGYLTGIFQMNSSSVTQADILSEAYVVDDNTVGLGIVAQPTNVTGVALERTSLSAGGTKSLAYTDATTLLSWGGGSGVDVSAGGTFTLTATDGSTLIATVTSGSLPASDQSDNIQLRNQKAGRIVEVVSAASVFIDISTAARS